MAVNTISNKLVERVEQSQFQIEVNNHHETIR